MVSPAQPAGRGGVPGQVDSDGPGQVHREDERRHNGVEAGGPAVPQRPRGDLGPRGVGTAVGSGVPALRMRATLHRAYDDRTQSPCPPRTLRPSSPVPRRASARPWPPNWPPALSPHRHRSPARGARRPRRPAYPALRRDGRGARSGPGRPGASAVSWPTNSRGGTSRSSAPMRALRRSGRWPNWTRRARRRRCNSTSSACTTLVLAVLPGMLAKQAGGILISRVGGRQLTHSQQRHLCRDQGVSSTRSANRCGRVGAQRSACHAAGARTGTRGDARGSVVGGQADSGF